VRRLQAQAWMLIALAAVAGCADNPMVLQKQVGDMQKQGLALQRQTQELQSRVNSLDRDNQELQMALSQTRQSSKVLEDQKKLLQDQLASVTTQLSRTRDEKKATDDRVQAMTASLQRQGAVTITPNNSLLKTLPTISRPDVPVRRDGDVIRVELPCQALFEPNSVQLRAGGPELVSQVATEILRSYPRQVIGVEGHTSSDPIANSTWRNNHQFSLSCASVVSELLMTQSRIPARQLMVVGHGANHPVVSNGKDAGKQRNCRVELVIYPEVVD
jgi:flagellar motor protein MotB